MEPHVEVLVPHLMQQFVVKTVPIAYFWPFICISGTTHLLLLGVDPFIVMVQGRWSSNSFLLYWRKSEEIVPLFISFSLNAHSPILTTMSCFKLISIDFGESVHSCLLAVTCHTLVMVELSLDLTCEWPEAPTPSTGNPSGTSAPTL